jgi:hypothetical protein
VLINQDPEPRNTTVPLAAWRELNEVFSKAGIADDLLDAN